MIPTVSQIFDAARAHLGDTQVPGGQVAKDSLLSQYWPNAYNSLYRWLDRNGNKTIRRTVFYNLPAYTAYMTPASFGVANMGKPQELYDRQIGATFLASIVAFNSPSLGVPPSVDLSIVGHGLSSGAQIISFGFDNAFVSDDINAEWYIKAVDANTIRLLGCSPTQIGSLTGIASPVVPTGTIDGTNAVFAVPSTISSGAAIFRNGILQDSTSYGLVGQTITFTAGNIPQVGDSLQAIINVTPVAIAGSSGIYSLPNPATGGVLIFLNGVLQSPTSYIVSGQTITFVSAPSGSDSVSAVLGVGSVAMTGTPDGLTTTFGIPIAVINGADVYRGGILQSPAIAYSLSGQTITFTAGNTPQAGDDLHVVVGALAQGIASTGAQAWPGVPLNREYDIDGLPLATGNGQLTSWKWENGAFWFVPATANRQVRIVFMLSGTPPTTGSVGIDDSMDALSLYLAGSLASAKEFGNRSQELFMRAVGNPSGDTTMIRGGAFYELAQLGLQTLTMDRIIIPRYRPRRNVGPLIQTGTSW